MLIVILEINETNIYFKTNRTIISVTIELIFVKIHKQRSKTIIFPLSFLSSFNILSVYFEKNVSVFFIG